MRDFPVPAPLAGFVSSVIAYREEIPTGQEVTERVLPDGAVRLIVELGDAQGRGCAGRPTLLAAGASAAPAILRLRGKLEGLSLALKPGAAAAILGVPAVELTGSVVALRELWRSEEGRMLERLADTANDAGRVSLLFETLRRRLETHDHFNRDAIRRQATRAAQLIARSSGQRPLKEIAHEIGIGERRLQQIFRLQVGLTPIQWSRLARIHGCLRALRAQPARGWADVAVNAGFYDQSHLVNEFKALCGMTPGGFLERTFRDFPRQVPRRDPILDGHPDSRGTGR